MLAVLQAMRGLQSQSRLAECQNAARNLAKFIGIERGEGTQTAELLNGYIELASRRGSKDHAKRMNMHLSRIENSIMEELKPDKIEAVFFPYKYSMADSLQSIWEAAMGDPQCDVYICPIPYFDRTPNGAFGAMHFEGDYYPKNLPLVDWQEYDVEKRLPDAIFIHNPYDDGNIVTSVHPNFYAKRLRGFTDLLVYSPYFVVGNDVLPDNFCTTAACIYAHRVILQSENVRQIYIRAFKETYGAHEHILGKTEDRFVALGSPKFDAVLSAKCDDFVLPDEWARLIHNKKVVFYNSTLGALLTGNEQYLKKLRYVLDEFRKRDDMVLWWRPHPLTVSTLNSMRQNLLWEYKQIVEDYKNWGRGIYDETPSPHAAISHSDAYYGDSSSLVPMYQATGKPVMIGCLHLPSDEIEFVPVCIFVTDSHIYCTVKNLNALFRMDKVTWALELVGSFPGEKNYIQAHYASLYPLPTENNGKMYFPPFLAKEIATYSSSSGVFEKIPFPRVINGKEIIGSFRGSVAYRKYVFFTPYLYPAIIRLDTETNEVACFSDWVEPINKYRSQPDQPFFMHPVVVGNSIWLVSHLSNAVVEFDMETCSSTVHEVGHKEFRFNGICCSGEEFWLSPFSNFTPLVKWNPKSGAIKEFSEIHIDKQDTGCFSIAFCNGYVWLFPVMGKHAVKIDVTSDNVSIAFAFYFSDEKNIEGQYKNKNLRTKVHNDTIFAFCEINKLFIEYNCATKMRREEFIRYPQKVLEQLERLIEQSFLQGPDFIDSEQDCLFIENEMVGLSQLLEYVVQENSDDEAVKNRRIEVVRSVNCNSDGAAGYAIFHYAKNLIL
jgi:hypothetical protein